MIRRYRSELGWRMCVYMGILDGFVARLLESKTEIPLQRGAEKYLHCHFERRMNKSLKGKEYWV